ncbi:hypothetical protein FB451DRAFT_1442322 [Mycena latifolia]|nr:hypothetical protein FB451DRAFT_1442322 [Mycena latifolia]
MIHAIRCAVLYFEKIPEVRLQLEGLDSQLFRSSMSTSIAKLQERINKLSGGIFRQQEILRALEHSKSDRSVAQRALHKICEPMTRLPLEISTEISMQCLPARSKGRAMRRCADDPPEHLRKAPALKALTLVGTSYSSAGALRMLHVTPNLMQCTLGDASREAFAPGDTLVLPQMQHFVFGWHTNIYDDFNTSRFRAFKHSPRSSPPLQSLALGSFMFDLDLEDMHKMEECLILLSTLPHLEQCCQISLLPPFTRSKYLHDALIARCEQVSVVQINCGYDAEPPADDICAMPLPPTAAQNRLNNIATSLNAAITTFDVVTQSLKTPFLEPISKTLHSLLTAVQVIFCT